MPIVSSSARGSLLTARVTLTNAQLLAIPTVTPVLVAAPGAGKLLRLVYGWVSKNFAGGAYTNIVGGAMYFAYDTVNQFDIASYALDASSVASWMGGAAIRQTSFGPAGVALDAGGFVAPSSSGADLRNTNLGFSIDNGGQNFTGGDAANTMTVAVYYTVETP